MARCSTQANDKATTTNNWTTPGAMVLGVTTLHHYERISSRDLEWHWRENGRGRQEVKLSCFFDKRVKPTNPEKVKPFREKNTTKMNEVENTLLEKRNKEEQIRAALRLKMEGIEDELVKMRGYLMKSTTHCLRNY